MDYVIGTKVRHIVLHYHLFKNGGHVIEAVLDKTFGDRLAHLRGNSHDSVVTNADWLSFLRNHAEVQAVSSYHFRPPRPETDDFVFFDILFIRQPLDRICVMFDSFNRAGNSSDPLVNIAQKNSLGGFSQRLMADYPHMIDNVQVNYLANGGRYIRPPNDSDLRRALRVVEQAAVPGVTHLFALALSTAEYYMRPAFGDLDLSYVTLNPCPSPEPWRSRVDHLREVCGPATYEKLVEMNKLDLQLVEFSQEEVRRRSRLVPNHEARLKKFVERCQAATEAFLEHDDIDA
jgi:hypothetical protein